MLQKSTMEKRSLDPEKVCEEHDGEAGHVHYRLMPYEHGGEPRNWLNHEHEPRRIFTSLTAPGEVNHEWVLHVPFFPIVNSPPLNSSSKVSLSIITSRMLEGIYGFGSTGPWQVKSSVCSTFVPYAMKRYRSNSALEVAITCIVQASASC